MDTKKEVTEKPLINVIKDIKSETEREIMKVLDRLHKNHGFTVTKINLNCGMVFNNGSKEPEPSYSVDIDLNYY
jgi:hypothetical protein